MPLPSTLRPLCFHCRDFRHQCLCSEGLESPDIIHIDNIFPVSRRDAVAKLRAFCAPYRNANFYSYKEWNFFILEFTLICHVLQQSYPDLATRDISDVFFWTIPCPETRSALRHQLRGTEWHDLQDPHLTAKLAKVGSAFYLGIALHRPPRSEESTLWFHNYTPPLLSERSARSILYLLTTFFAELSHFPAEFSIAHLAEFRNRMARHCLLSLSPRRLAYNSAFRIPSETNYIDDDVYDEVPSLASTSHSPSPTSSDHNLSPPPYVAESPIEEDPPSPDSPRFMDEDYAALQLQINVLKFQLDEAMRTFKSVQEPSVEYSFGAIFDANHAQIRTSTDFPLIPPS